MLIVYFLSIREHKLKGVNSGTKNIGDRYRDGTSFRVYMEAI